MFNISDGLVVRNVERNVVGSGEQFSLQMTDQKTDQTSSIWHWHLVSV